jgi:hypothetical protein
VAIDLPQRHGDHGVFCRNKRKKHEAKKLIKFAGKNIMDLFKTAFCVFCVICG